MNEDLSLPSDPIERNYGGHYGPGLTSVFTDVGRVIN
jgi:hypothetical protein